MVELAYRASAGCPSREDFEQRLRRRLGARPDARLPAALAIALTIEAAQATGEITVTSGPRRGARRRVTAASCEEAVDALTLVTTLLFEPAGSRGSRGQGADGDGAPARAGRRASQGDRSRARAAAPEQGPPADGPAQTAQTERSAASGAAPIAPAQGTGVGGETAPNLTAREGSAPAGSTRESSASEGSARAGSAPQAPIPARAETVREGGARPAPDPAGAGPASREDKAPAVNAPPAAAREAASQPPSRSPVAPESAAELAAPRRLELDLALTGMIALGTLPAARPGLAARVSGGLGVAPAWTLALALSGRGLLPQRAESGEGDARFRFYAGGLALCARHRAGRFASSGCAQSELGLLSARGENTLNARAARALFAAFGPRAESALTLAGPLVLQAGVELLFPTASDRFEVGQTALFTVPPLTFRAELGLGVHFE